MGSVGLVPRVLPPGLYAGRGRMLIERSLLVNRHAWLTFVSGFFEPLFYLLAFQVGFGTLVHTVAGPGGEPMSYVAFVAPGLLAASAMNGAVYDATFNVFFKFRYDKVYEAVLSTPLGPLDVAAGEIGWALLRGGAYAVAFIGVMLGMGLLGSPWAVLLLPAALLVALAFAALGMACVTFLRSVNDLDLIQLAVLPMFLLSTTFYPLTVYPGTVRIVVECFPLYQAVALMRELAAGLVGWPTLGHAAYLLVMAAVGISAAAHRIGRLLLR